jgi:nucleoid-associated protein YgaU
MIKALLLLSTELLAIVMLWNSGPFLDPSHPVDLAVSVLRLASLAWLAWMVISTTGALVSTHPQPSNPLVRAFLQRAVATAIVTGVAMPTQALALTEDTTVVIPAGAFVGPAAHEEAAPPAVGGSMVTVQQGDNLWRIAERHLRSTDSKPSPREVATYWVEVVAANTPHLRSGNPDLIYPGETIELPPV